MIEYFLKKTCVIGEREREMRESFHTHIIILLLASFPHQLLTCGFSLKSKWQKVSSDLRNSLEYFDNAIVWMVSIFLLVSTTTIFFLVLDDCTKGSTYNRNCRQLHVHYFFNSPARSEYLYSFSFSFNWVLFERLQLRFQFLCLMEFAPLWVT